MLFVSFNFTIIRKRKCCTKRLNDGFRLNGCIPTAHPSICYRRVDCGLYSVKSPSAHEQLQRFHSQSQPSRNVRAVRRSTKLTTTSTRVMDLI